MEKKINEIVFSNYKESTMDAYEDVLMHPDSEYRKQEVDILIDKVYREGFSDGLTFLTWLNQD